MNLCESIDTLAMALHDGELAGEELRDLELHLTECASCRDAASAQATAIGSLRRKLAPPPTPDMLRAKIRLGLDAEDRAARKPLTSWLLPGGAVVAAAAALALFLTARPTATGRSVEGVVAKIASTVKPLEVKGAATTEWVERHYDANVAVPTFSSARIDLWGARLVNVYDRDGVMLIYRVTTPEEFTRDLTVVVFDARGFELDGNNRVTINDRVLSTGMEGSTAMVTYLDSYKRAFMFSSTQMSLDELIDVVGSSSLLIQVSEHERQR